MANKREFRNTLSHKTIRSMTCLTDYLAAQLFINKKFSWDRTNNNMHTTKIEQLSERKIIFMDFILGESKSKTILRSFFGFPNTY